MAKWDYYFLHYRPESLKAAPMPEPLISRLGDEGWELAAAYPVWMPDKEHNKLVYNGVMFCFKRERPVGGNGKIRVEVN